MTDVKAAIEDLVEAGMLTERQAEAYVYRELVGFPRPDAAAQMDVSVNTLDNRLRAAKDKIEVARETVDTVSRLQEETLPRECSECGRMLGGRWVEDDEGNSMCIDCADVDPL
jgi:formylmethanofuran dehydrogenase subunit E